MAGECSGAGGRCIPVSCRFGAAFLRLVFVSCALTSHLWRAQRVLRCRCTPILSDCFEVSTCCVDAVDNTGPVQCLQDICTQPPVSSGRRLPLLPHNCSNCMRCARATTNV